MNRINQNQFLNSIDNLQFTLYRALRVKTFTDVAFSSAAYFSATAIYEIGHSTGHESRMKRDLSGKFGSESYALE